MSGAFLDTFANPPAIPSALVSVFTLLAAEDDEDEDEDEDDDDDDDDDDDKAEDAS